MPVSRTMRRLFHILQLEEEQRRRTLDSALGELTRLEHALAAAAIRDSEGRKRVAASAHTGEFADRLAGLEEARVAARVTAILEPRLAEARRNTAERREEFLEKRVERRQVETLVQHAEDRAAIEAGRRSQRALDDWHLSRLRREQQIRDKQS